MHAACRPRRGACFWRPMVGNESDFQRAKEIAHRMVFNEGMGSTIKGSEREVEAVIAARDETRNKPFKRESKNF